MNAKQCILTVYSISDNLKTKNANSCLGKASFGGDLIIIVFVWQLQSDDVDITNLNETNLN